MRMIRAFLVVALVVLGACGGGGSSKPSASSTTSHASGKAPNPAFVDIQTCDNVGGRGQGSGTVENQGTRTVSYTLTIGFFDEGSERRLGAGRDTTKVIAPGASASWSVGAKGLGDAAIVCHTVAITSRGGTASSTSTTTAAASTEFPCDLVPTADVVRIVGSPLDAGDATTNHVTENTTTWTAHQCSWGTPAGQVDITLEVTRRSDDPSGWPGCPPVPGSAIPVVGIGTTASWAWVDPGTEVTVGTLRVCTDTVLLDAGVTSATTGDEHLAAARALAEQALAAL